MRNASYRRSNTKRGGKMSSRKDFEKKKKSLVDYPGLNLSPNTNPVEKFKSDLIDFIRSNSKGPFDLVNREVCSESDANKIFKNRTDFLTSDFLLIIANRLGFNQDPVDIKNRVLLMGKINVSDIVTMDGYSDDVKIKKLRLEALLFYITFNKIKINHDKIAS